MRPLPLVLVLLLCGVAYAGPDEHALMVSDAEFVTLHVGGYPGADLVFWVRWDSDDVIVHPDAELHRYSRTLAQNALGQASDMVCFGSRCVRMPLAVGYAPAEAGALDPALQLSLPISGHKGVLGLGRRSPVWDHFRYYKFNANELVLSSRRPVQDGPSYDLVRRSMITAQQLNYVPFELDGTRLWAQLRLDVDYVFVPHAALVTATALRDKHYWTMRVYDTEDGHRVRGRFNLDREHNRATVRDGTQLNIVRPFGRALVMMSSARAAQAAELSATTNDTWTASEVAVLGRALLVRGFSVFGDALTHQLTVQVHWSSRAAVDASQFWPYYLPLGVLLFVWIFVVQDSAKEHQEALVPAHAGRPYDVPAGSALFVDDRGDHDHDHRSKSKPKRDRADRELQDLQAELVGPADRVLSAPPMPPDIMQAARRASTRASYRNPHFIQWLLLATELCVIIFLTSLLFGLGFLDQFWRHGFDAYHQAALYSCFLMIYAQLVLANMVATHPEMAAVFGQNALLLCLWLLAAMERSDGSSAAIMVLTAGWTAQYALAQLAAFCTGVLWPIKAYTRTFLHRAAFGAVLTIAAAFSVWFFSFFTVTSVAEQWDPEDPLGWIFGCFSLLIIAVCALQTYNNVRVCIATVYKWTLELMAALAHEQLRTIDAAEQSEHAD
jgi:hypothetical protein